MIYQEEPALDKKWSRFMQFGNAVSMCQYLDAKVETAESLWKKLIDLKAADSVWSLAGFEFELILSHSLYV